MLPNGDEAADIRRQLIATWLDAGTQESQPEMLPTELSVAARAVLGADAAGLSLLNERFRIPLGASDDEAFRAERLQFTVGDGPCLTALRERRSMRLDEAEIAARWPVYFSELTRATPYRSVVSVPMSQTVGFVGALDVYFTSGGMPAYEVMTNAELVANEIKTLLSVANGAGTPPDDTSPPALPSWMAGSRAQERMNTWIATGLLMATRGVRSAEALDVLRAYAYARETTSDEVAARLISGRLDPEDVATPPRT